MNYRALVEKNLGRKLARSEHVHHIDGNRDNNCLSNLRVVNKDYHQKVLHGSHEFKDGKFFRICRGCGSEIYSQNGERLTPWCWPCQQKRIKSLHRFTVYIPNHIVDKIGFEVVGTSISRLKNELLKKAGYKQGVNGYEKLPKSTRSKRKRRKVKPK